MGVDADALPEIPVAVIDVRFSLGGQHNARVERTVHCSFDAFVKALLRQVPETTDKASVGWICGAEFDPAYRDSENFVARHLLSFDYDHIDPADVPVILETFGVNAFLAYTTWSHTVEAPRIRVWLPLSRPCGYDEFQAVSRAVAARFDIEKMARESHVPAQYMFRPAQRTAGVFQHWENVEGAAVDVDEVLTREYFNWTDRAEWPHRADGDGVHTSAEGKQSPLDKPGIIGEFCRAFTIPEAIERFSLPYVRAATEGRYTYTAGSRPEGAILYDDGTKLHSHHDTDPAHGQCNAFDLVRMHVLGWLDTSSDQGLLVSERPSFKAMVQLALEQPEVRAERAAEVFENLDETDPEWLALPPGIDRGDARSSAGEIPKARSRCTDLANTGRLQRIYGNQIVSVHDQFYWWQGTHWRAGDTEVWRCAAKLAQIVRSEAHALEEKIQDKIKGLSEEDIRAALRAPTKSALSKTAEGLEQIEALKSVESLQKWATACEMSGPQDAAVKLLRRLLTLDAARLNADPWAFTCTNGTIDLRTGALRPHNPNDYITLCAPTPYFPGAEAPRFQQFLREIFNSNESVIAFMRRWFGYCMTGSVAEQALMIHVGPGGNGKGTLLETLSAVVGEYAATAAPRLILTGDRHPAEVADLMGRRMVTVSETDDATTLAEGVVKQMTGGDRLKARRMYGDFFEFLPTHKLQVFTNLRPQIKGQDYGMWRRLLLMSYPVRYGRPEDVAKGAADKVRDLALGATLRAEAPGILRWLVDGAREWHETGLKPPDSVMAAVRTYQQEQDRMSQFVGERCVADPAARQVLSGGAGIYPAYMHWCRESGYTPLGKGRFQQDILRVMPGAQKADWKEGTGDVRRKVNGFTGIKLTEESFDD